MIKDKKVIGIIPARSGSVRLEDKNFREFADGMNVTELCAKKCSESKYIDFTYVVLNFKTCKGAIKLHNQGLRNIDNVAAVTRTNDDPEWFIMDVAQDVAKSFFVRKDDVTKSVLFDHNTIVVIMQVDHPNFNRIDEAIEQFVESEQSELMCVRSNGIKNGAIRIVDIEFLLNGRMSHTGYAFTDDTEDIHFLKDFEEEQKEYERRKHEKP